MKRKLISLILSCLMLIRAIPAIASTETKEDVSVKGFLNSLGIDLPDEADTKNLEEPIRKKELVYLIVEAMDKNSHSENTMLTFPDVKLDAWYHDNDVFAANIGLVYGRADGTFGIDDNIDEQTAALIMFRVLGFEEVSKMGVSNPISTYSSVYQNLFKGVNRDGVLTLKESYRMIYNMLMSEYVSFNMNAAAMTFEVVNDKVYMESVFDIKKQKGRITGNEYTQLGIKAKATGKNMIEIDGIAYDTIIDDTRTYLGYYVDYYIKESRNNSPVVVYAIPDKSNEITKISSIDLLKIESVNNRISIVYNDEKQRQRKVLIPMNCDFVYNGKNADFSMNLLTKLNDEQYGQILCVECRDSFLLSVTSYETVIVDAVSKYEECIYDKNGLEPISIQEPELPGFLNVYKEGEEASIDQIQKGDVLQIARTLDGSGMVIEICNYSLTGKLTEGISDKELSIDGVSYPVSNYFIKRMPKIELGIKQTFLFNNLGEVIDVLGDSCVYDGEYVFLVDAKDYSEEQDNLAVLQYVTMDANMVKVNLAEKVRLNGGKRVYAPAVVEALLSKNGEVEHRVIYIEKNDDGFINVIYTPDGKDVDGLFHEQEYITLDAKEKNRKCKNSILFLEDTNDANFPEFYIGDDTKILMVPNSTASQENFKDNANYKKLSKEYFHDAQDYTVEAYNFDEFNVSDVLILRRSNVFESRYSGNSIVVVTGTGQSLDIFDDVCYSVKGYQDGKRVEILLEDENVLYYTEDAEKTKIKKGDVARFNLNEKGKATHSEYVMNVDNVTITDYPMGQNDGQAYVVGYVVDKKDNYLRLKFTDKALVKERVFRGNFSEPTIYNRATGKCEAGTYNDLTPGKIVLLRVMYSWTDDVVILD